MTALKLSNWSSKLKPDIVIIDVAMPRMNGIEATKKIKEILPGTKILVLTGYDYDEYIFSLLEIGAAGYLLKDVSGDELVGAIRAVYHGRACSPSHCDAQTYGPL